MANPREKFIEAAVPLDKDTTGYSYFYITTETRNLDELFRLRVLKTPLSRESERRIKTAQLFNGGSAETQKVITYYLDIVRKTGHFVALPYDEIQNASGGNLSRDDLKKALEDGYLQVSFYPGEKLAVAELTEKFSPFIGSH